MKNPDYISLAYQNALWNKMMTVSNNMANINTSGFKKDSLLFSTHLHKIQTTEAHKFETVSFPKQLGIAKDFSLGNFEHTGNTLDLALEGKGFFALQTPAGEMYTRNGKFRIDSEGRIVTDEGYPLLSQEGEAIFISPQETQILISKDGRLETENGLVATLRLVDFQNPQELSKHTGTLFYSESEPIFAENASVAQGFIETSNVNGIIEITEIIDIQRKYEAIMRIMENETKRRRQTFETYRGQV